MPRNSTRLPKRFPAGSTYVVESRGSVQDMTLVNRYVRFPDGRRVDLAARLVPSCGSTDRPKARRGAPVRRQSLAHSGAT